MSNPIDPVKQWDEEEVQEKKPTADEFVKSLIKPRVFDWKSQDRRHLSVLIEKSLQTAMKETVPGATRDIFLRQANRLEADLKQLDRYYPPKKEKKRESTKRKNKSRK